MYGAFENPKIGGEYLSLISVLEGEHEYSNGITAIYDELTKKDKKWDFKGKVLEVITRLLCNIHYSEYSYRIYVYSNI